jgi:hypothetical protein
MVVSVLLQGHVRLLGLQQLTAITIVHPTRPVLIVEPMDVHGVPILNSEKLLVLNLAQQLVVYHKLK